MIDWLRRDPRHPPEIELDGRSLPVVVRRLDRARRMTLRLAPDGSEVRITIPRWTPGADALAFAQSRRDWLLRQLSAVPAPVIVASGMALPYRGAPLTLHHDPAAARRPAIDGGHLRIGGPATSLPARLRRWLAAEAHVLLAADLVEYCARAGHEPPRLALSNARRRWGSCAADGTIRINWRLIMAPDAVRRSVVAHEVAHLVHFDHSPAFHAALADLFEGSVDEANRWLSRQGRTLYLPFG
ncbi:M48 family metallopeptidase [Novosphingobium colocasiae]|uniref:M48 family metallopeptidase n=1 Tax=Novosphingobium colocasiae TaxID=1256513 RepID=UPI0035AF8E98